MKKNTLRNILLVIFACAFLFSGYQLYSIYSAYHAAESEYSSIEETYVTIAEPVEDTAPVTDVVAGEEKNTGRPGIDYPDLRVDFEELCKVNGETMAWIYMESCEISYPVVQGTDNEYYLHVTLSGEPNSSGTIFMDYLSSPDFTDYNTFVFGHNMKNGSMFGSLKRLHREEGLCDSNPYFYIYTRDGEVLKYRIFSYYITPDTSDTYINPQTEEEFEEYIAKIRECSIYDCDVEVGTEDMLATMSTCSGTSGTERFVVHGVLEARYAMP